MRPNPLLSIFLIVLVDILGLTIILPLLPFYAEHFGASPLVVGTLVAVFAVCQLIAGPLLGKMSDRTGRKPLLIVSQIGTFIGFLVLAFAQNLGMIFLSRIIDGLTAGNLSLAQAYISDISEPENRAKSFGVIGVAFGLGFLVGPGLSAYLARYGYRYPIYVAAGLSCVSILATTLLLPKALPQHSDANDEPARRRKSILHWQSYAPYFTNPRLAPLLFQFFLFCLSFATFSGGFALFAERRYRWEGVPFAAQHVGYVFTYAGLLGIILQGGLIGRLVKKFGEPRLVSAGFITLIVGHIALGLSCTVAGLFIAATITSFGNGVLRPALTSLITRGAGRKEQGTVLGLTQSLMSVAQIVGPLSAGLLISHNLLLAWAFLIAAIACWGLVSATRPLAAAPAT